MGLARAVSFGDLPGQDRDRDRDRGRGSSSPDSGSSPGASPVARAKAASLRRPLALALVLGGGVAAVLGAGLRASAWDTAVLAVAAVLVALTLYSTEAEAVPSVC